MTVGIVGFLSGMVIAANEDPALDTRQLPLGHPSGLAVDADGRVYVGSRAYWRISRFHADGRFDRSWHVPSGRGEYHFTINAANQLIAAIGSGAQRRFYTVNETGLAEVEPAAWSAPPSTPSSFAHPDGTNYALNPFLLTVDKVAKDGTRSSAIRVNPLWLLVAAPIHAWLTVAIGLLLAGPARSGPSKKQPAA